MENLTFSIPFGVKRLELGMVRKGPTVEQDGAKSRGKENCWKHDEQNQR